MADRPTDDEPGGTAGDDAGVGSDRESPPGMPRWVKVSGIVIGAVILLVVAIMLIAGGHGPGRHGASSPAAAVPSSSP